MKKNLLDISLDNDFLGITLKANAKIAKINKGGFHQTENP